MRIVLTHEKKLYVLDEPIPEAPPIGAHAAQRNSYNRYLDAFVEIFCIMLATMTPELQKHHEGMTAFDMIEHLKTLYEEKARHERFDVSKALFSTKLSEGSPVGPLILKMIGYVENLARLGLPLERELAVDLILQSLVESFGHFVQNFLMNEMEKTLPQLAAMLRTAEKNMKGKGKAILMVNNGKFKRLHKKPNKFKGNGKGKAVAKPSTKALKPTGGVAKEGKCFYCGKTGHWKRSCPKYLEDKKNGTVVSTSSGIFVIKINMSTSTSWVLDTGYGSHICNDV